LWRALDRPKPDLRPYAEPIPAKDDGSTGKMNIKMISERVRDTREKSDLTIRELAAASGLLVGTIHALEHANSSSST
jgi:hypothetical protein